MPLVVHREIPIEMEHETDSETCWCRPVIVEDDDLRTTEEIIEAAKIAEA